MNNFKCDICGQFISYDDLNRGNAAHNLVAPDSIYTSEEWETYHVECDKKSRERSLALSDQRATAKGM